MSKLQLPSVTLCIIDCINADKAIKVLEHCKKMCDFGAVKLLTSTMIDYPHRVEIMPLNSLVAYSVFMLTRFHEYISTEHCLVVQADGWILNPQSFDMSWLDTHYCAPLFMQYPHVGSGGFSLRSKKIMERAAEVTPRWDGTQKHAEIITSKMGYYEDGVLSFSDKFKDFKKATPEQAADFAQGGNRDPRYFREYSFGFHRTFQLIDFKTGRIDSSDTAKDIQNSYDFEISQL